MLASAEVESAAPMWWVLSLKDQNVCLENGRSTVVCFVLLYDVCVGT